jgi:hypothetical protein
METIRIAIELDGARLGGERLVESRGSSKPAAVELHLLIQGEPRGLRADTAIRSQWASAYADGANALITAPLPRLREIV